VPDRRLVPGAGLPSFGVAIDRDVISGGTPGLMLLVAISRRGPAVNVLPPRGAGALGA
jgi:hypothetical protein